MTPSTIIKQVVATFKADPDVTAIVDPNNIFEGIRDNIVTFPCIVIESVGDRLLEQSMPFEKIVQTVKIGAVVQVYNKDIQLEEMLTLKNVIKKCVSNNEMWGLEGVIQSVNVSSADDNTNYPYRGFELNVDITYRQDRKLRT